MAKQQGLDEVLAEVAYMNARIEAVEAKVGDMQKREAEAQAKADLSPEQRDAEDQHKINQALEGLKRNRERLDAVIKNTQAPKPKRTPQPGEAGYGVPGQEGYTPPPGHPRESQPQYDAKGNRIIA